MSYSKSDYLAGAILDAYLSGGGATPFYVLSSTYIDYDGTGGTEWSVGRVDVSGALSRSGRVVDNPSEVVLTNSLPAPDDGVQLPFWAVYDAASGGNLLYIGTVSTVRRAFSADPTADTLCVDDNPFVDDDQVRLVDAPAGLTNGVSYFVVNTSGNAFQLSLTQGGLPVDITAAGTGVVGDDAALTPSTGNEVRIPANSVVFNA